MTRLFVYGTLMNKEVLTSLLGCSFKKSNAILPAYKCVLVSAEVYPAIYPDQNSSVSGQILHNLSMEQINLLDDYEGLNYKRVSVTVIPESGIAQQCEVYVYKPEFYNQLSDNSWCNEKFRREHMASFLHTS